MNAQDLENSILQLAVQGKLVEQRKEEGTAEELYNQIQEEKAKLIKEGKLKKEKQLSEITEDGIPFEIPESWKWVRLSNVIDVRDGTHDTPKYVTEGVPLVTSKNLTNGMIDFDNVKLISIEDAENINKRSGVDNGDILFAMIGSIGNPVLVKKDREFSIKNMALFKTINNSMFIMEYLFWYLKKEQDIMKKKATGGVQSFVSLSFLRNYLFPIPPLEEQKRIVAKIEELMSYVEEYGDAHSKLEEFNKRFPEDMQKSILQYAIQGKLVEQREEEGTAEELYQQIQKEKARPIKEGKIKKEKLLAEITEEEIPFEIPGSWKWVRLGDVFQIINGDRGKNYPSKDKLTNKGIPFISALNIENQTISEEKLLYMSEEQYERLGSGKLILGDLVLCIRGSLGKNGRYPFKKGAIASSLVILRSYIKSEIYYEFISTYINSQLFSNEVIKYNNGTAQPNLGARDLAKFIIPLPPLEEQKRIVNRIEELILFCKQIKN